jgi:hypothetical protein
MDTGKTYRQQSHLISNVVHQVSIRFPELCARFEGSWVVEAVVIDYWQYRRRNRKIAERYSFSYFIHSLHFVHRMVSISIIYRKKNQHTGRADNDDSEEDTDHDNGHTDHANRHGRHNRLDRRDGRDAEGAPPEKRQRPNDNGENDENDENDDR